MCIYVLECMYSVCVYLYVGVYTCIYAYMCLRVHVSACYSDTDPLVRSGPSNGDLNWIQICARCGSDSQAIRRMTYEMI